MNLQSLLAAIVVLIGAALIGVDLAGIYDVEAIHFRIAVTLIGIGAVFLALMTASKLPAIASTAAIVMVGALSIAPFFTSFVPAGIGGGGSAGAGSGEAATAGQNVPLTPITCAANAKELDHEDLASSGNWNGMLWTGALIPSPSATVIVDCLKWTVTEEGYYSIEATEEVSGDNRILDPLLVLYTVPEGGYGPQEIEFNDDGGIDSNPRISRIIPPGDYVILIGIQNAPMPRPINLRIRNATPGSDNAPLVHLNLDDFAADAVEAVIDADGDAGAWFDLTIPNPLIDANGAPVCFGIEAMPIDGVDPIMRMYEYRAGNLGQALPGELIAINDDGSNGYRGLGAYLYLEYKASKSFNGPYLFRVEIVGSYRPIERVAVKAFIFPWDSNREVCIDPRSKGV